jgi:hypothetical protein
VQPFLGNLRVFEIEEEVGFIAEELSNLRHINYQCVNS